MLLYRMVSILSAGLMLFPGFAQPDEISWLSGEPPAETRGIRESGMQHYFVLSGKRGAEDLILWFRAGNDFQNNGYRHDSLLENETFVSFSPTGEFHDYTFKYFPDSCFAVTYPFREEGYFNFYLISREVKNEILYVHTAKAERLSHKCRSGHKHILEKIKPGKTENIPFEVVRQRMNFEDLHVMIESGSEIHLTALLDGEPVSNARISITTQEGWERQTETDNSGEARFQLISDYFSNWQDIEKKHISRLLVKGYFDQAGTGEYLGNQYLATRYSTSLELDYIPTPLMYKSKSWAVIAILVSFVILSSVIYGISGRNRRRWNKMIRDEK